MNTVVSRPTRLLPPVVEDSRMHVRPRPALGTIVRVLLAACLLLMTAGAQQAVAARVQESSPTAAVAGAAQSGSPDTASSSAASGAAASPATQSAVQAAPAVSEAPATVAPAQPAPASPPSSDSSTGAEQANPSAPLPQVNAPEPPPASRVDLYGGYAFLKPSGSIGIYSFQQNNVGYIVSGTGYFTRHIGVQFEFAHSQNDLGTTGPAQPPPFVQLGGTTDCFSTAEAGPVYRFFVGSHLSPFVHVVGGGAKVGGPKFQQCTWGYGVTTGLGVDYVVPKFNDHLAVRVVQADYEYMHVDHGAIQQYDLDGGTATVNALRLSAGLVVRLGEMQPKLDQSLACDVNPAEVYSGERVTVSAVTRNYNPKLQYAYRWELSGGKVDGFGPSVFIDTTGMAAGAYTAVAHVSKTAKSKQVAQCSVSFTIKPSPAPTLKCSANPTTVNPGDPSTITSYATSIAQRKLTYSYSASAGQIGGRDQTTQLHTDGVPPGMITVTCRVQDDLGQTAQATTEVTVSAPPVPAAPKAQQLCTVTFNRDAARPARVDNEGRACLDDIALTLQHQPEARLVLVGNHADTEVDGQIVAAERAINTRAYLSKEKGIDPSRVDLRTGSEPGKQVDTYLLIPGAVFDQPTEGRIDESKITIHGQQYATPQPAPRPKARRRSQQTGIVGEGVSKPPR
jgi:hypothetical protein